MPGKDKISTRSSNPNVASMNRSYTYDDFASDGNVTSGKLPFEENDEARFRREAQEKIDEETDPENFQRFGTPWSTGYYGEEEDEFERYPIQLRDHAGKGPKGYRRSDDRIFEDVNEVLFLSADVDASDIEVNVRNGVVTLSGFVDSRLAKKIAENCADTIPGVQDIFNNLEIRR